MSEESAINVHVDDDGITEDEESLERRRRVRRLAIYLAVLVALLLLVLYIAGLRQETTPPPPAVAPIAFSGPWVDVETFDGPATRRIITKRFTITSETWRIVWSYKPTENIGVNGSSFLFFLRDDRNLPRPHDNVVLVGTAFEPQSATWNLRTKPGKYFFDVVANSADWKIRVQQTAPKPATK